MIDEDRLPWFHCYPGKLLGALAEMSADQQLVYMIVLLRIYEVRGPLKDPITALARRCDINKRRVSEALDALFRVGKLSSSANGIMNPFAEKMIVAGTARHRELARAGAEGGKRSAEKRKEKQTPPSSQPTSQPKADGKHLDLEKKERIPLPSGEGAPGVEPIPVQSALAPDNPATADIEAERQFFIRGKAVLGKQAGGMIRNLLASKGSVALARAAIEQASEKANPREYIGAMIRPRGAAPVGRSGNGFAAVTAKLMQKRKEREDHDAQSDDAAQGKRPVSAGRADGVLEISARDRDR